MITCKVCGKADPEHIFHCEEHYRCADCGTKDGLCTYTDAVLCDPCHEKRIEKRITEFDGDTDFEPEVTCPWCGYVHSDSWEYPDSDEDFECSDCGRSFFMEREVSVSYSTSRPDTA